MVSATAHTQQCDWRCELAINESKKMAALARREQLAALARSEHERAAKSLPAAALPQRAFSENTTKRDIPTFVRARIREFEAARECVVILAACLGVLFFESRRWRGVCSMAWRTSGFSRNTQENHKNKIFLHIVAHLVHRFHRGSTLICKLKKWTMSNQLNNNN